MDVVQVPIQNKEMYTLFLVKQYPSPVEANNVVDQSLINLAGAAGWQGFNAPGIPAEVEGPELD